MIQSADVPVCSIMWLLIEEALPAVFHVLISIQECIRSRLQINGNGICCYVFYKNGLRLCLTEPYDEKSSSHTFIHVGYFFEP